MLISHWSNLLILLYTLVFYLIIWYSPFYQLKGVPRQITGGLFVIKVIFGLAYGLISYYLIRGNDTFVYFGHALRVYDVISDDPLAYLRLIFGLSGVEVSDELTPVVKSLGKHWTNAQHYMMIRFNALVRIFSFGNYYVHPVFMAFASFTGLVAIYKTLVEVKAAPSRLLMLSLFVIPSVLFWGSGVHKEGLLLFCLGMYLWSYHRLLTQRRDLGSILLMGFSALVIFIVRDYFFAFLLINSLAYLWAIKRPAKPLLKFLGINTAALTAAVLLGVIFPSLNILDQLVEMQGKLQLFVGSSDIGTLALNTSWGSLLAALPRAAVNVFFRPFPFEATNLLQLFSGLEVTILSLIGMFCIWKRKESVHPMVYLLLFFALATILLYGVVVPNLGALARYRTISLLMLVLCYVSILDPRHIPGQIGTWLRRD